ncbi:testis-expressed sequence 10 protein [Vespula squamosa]|uniref:Testis-expressed sequence 10 protein n=1 Tax=Vespula squamosa TaxID=30214 RepID=A0ABD2C4V6_VESSQ
MPCIGLTQQFAFVVFYGSAPSIARLQHHNSTVRQETVKELKDILLQHPLEILSSQLNPVLQGISALSFDKETDIRKDSLKSIVNLKTDTNGKSLDATELIKYISVLMRLMFDSWIEVCPEERNNKISETIVFSEASILLKHIKQLITEYTDILDNNDHISRLQHHNSTVRQETVKELKDILLQHPLEILSSQLNPVLQGISALSFDKETDIRKDSLKVLNYILNSISNEQLLQIDIQDYKINFESIVNLKTDTNGKSLDATELIKYISVLMHLMFDSWIEVCPEERNNKISETIVFSEASILLKHIKQLITEYTDILDNNDHISRLQHHNSTVRQETVKELKDILLQHPLEILSSQLNPVLQGISALSFDKETDIRKDSLKVLNYILNSISNEQLL